jgi:hypothetical protein
MHGVKCCEGLQERKREGVAALQFGVCQNKNVRVDLDFVGHQAPRQTLCFFPQVFFI